MKGLKALENIKQANIIFHTLDITDEIFEIEKELIALEIIKEKRVDLIRLFQCFKIGGLSNYNDFYAYKKLTQKEYDLLKEVLL